jgi:hypothetical protein
MVLLISAVELLAFNYAGHPMIGFSIFMVGWAGRFVAREVAHGS